MVETVDFETCTTNGHVWLFSLSCFSSLFILHHFLKLLWKKKFKFEFSSSKFPLRFISFLRRQKQKVADKNREFSPFVSEFKHFSVDQWTIRQFPATRHIFKLRKSIRQIYFHLIIKRHFLRNEKKSWMSLPTFSCGGGKVFVFSVTRQNCIFFFFLSQIFHTHTHTHKKERTLWEMNIETIWPAEHGMCATLTVLHACAFCLPV